MVYKLFDFSNMKKIHKLLLAFIPFVTSCTAYQVIDSGYDSNINFSHYKSFAWIPVSDSTNTPYDNSEFRNSLIKKITQQLIKQKYVATNDTPDFYIELIVSYTNQMRFEDVPVPQFIPYSNNQPMRGSTSSSANRGNTNYQTTASNYVPTPRVHFESAGPTKSETPCKTVAVGYMEDFVTINIIDSKTNEVILSITSEADIDCGNEIPDSSKSIAKHLVKKLLQMRKENFYSNL